MKILRNKEVPLTIVLGAAIIKKYFVTDRSLGQDE